MMFRGVIKKGIHSFHIIVLWGVTPCDLVLWQPGFGGMYYFHLLARRVNWIEKWFSLLPLNMEAADSSKMLVLVY